jgi:hypothetical protein
MQKGVILPLFYLPPIEFFSVLLSSVDSVAIERFEHFPKQTFRNRATIYSPNGPLNLIVPVLKGSKTHTKVKDVKISYEYRWQRLHWMSLQTCYRSSSYFEFYEDDLAGFYHKKWDYLFDYSLEILEFLLQALKIKSQLTFTEEYLPEYENLTDYRTSIHPKSASTYAPKPYFQLFEERGGFIPNLSIADVLFNHGPLARKYI